MHPKWIKEKYSKYGNKKTVRNNIVFDSKKEADRYSELLILQRCGKIKDLQRQVKYTLIPAQRNQSEIMKNGKIKQGSLIERECYYVADFVYFDIDGNKTIVEDCKGVKTDIYLIKRKLMLWVHKIKIFES